jgi:hypothetical protein
LKIKAECIGIVDLILLDSSDYQSQDGVKHPQQDFSFLQGIEMLLNILQG